MCKISFILPCYNVDRYIADCLDSILKQNMSSEDFEVICVNDCSTDNTGSIIRNYVKSNPNFIIIDHKENMTTGGARNTGISVAQGEFIWFVDPDDLIKPNSAVSVYNIAKKNDTDILFFNYDVIDEELSFIKTESTFINSEVLNGQNYVTKFFPNNLSKICIVWYCLFKNFFLKENNLRFPLMRKAQDVSFLWKCLPYALRVSSVNGSYYQYRMNPYSVTNKTKDAKVFFSERILFAFEIINILRNNSFKLQKPIANDMWKTVLWCVNSNFDIIRQMPKYQLEGYYNEMITHRYAIKELTKYMNTRHRVLFSMFGGKQFWVKKIQILNKFY